MPYRSVARAQIEVEDQRVRRTLTMADRPRYYVSLGETGSADARGADSLLYQNQDEAFPEWIGRDLRSRLPGYRLLSLTAEGAVSAGVRYSQLPRLAELGVAPDLITVNLGVNDLLPCFDNDDALRNATETFVTNASIILQQVRRVATDNSPILVNAMPVCPGEATAAWALRCNEALVWIAMEVRALIVDLPDPSDGSAIRKAWWNTLTDIGFL